jgi:hypothetical protein
MEDIMKFVLMQSGKIKVIGSKYSTIIPVSAQTHFVNTLEGKVWHGECQNCKKKEMVFYSRKYLGPEAILQKFKCLNCGEKESDVLD